MKTNNNQYIAPECEEIRIRIENGIAASLDKEGVSPTYHGFENEQTW